MRLARLRWLVGLALLGVDALLLGALPAAAQSRINVPEGCGSEQEFRSELERLTGAPVPADVPSSLIIEALGGGRQGYELRLELADERRVLRDSQCRILWRSAIVIVAAASRAESTPTGPSEDVPTDATGAQAGPAPSPPAPLPATVTPAPAPNPSAPAPAMPPPQRPPVGAGVAPARPPVSAAFRRRQRAARQRTSRSGRAQIRPPPEQREASTAPLRAPAPSERRAPSSVDPALGVLRFGVDAGLGVSAGVLPDLGVVVDVGARVEVLPWALGLTLRYWPERTASREGRAVDVSALGGRVVGLFRVAPAWTLLAGLEVNRLVGEGGEGVSGRSAAPAWQLAPTLGMTVTTWNNQYLKLEVGAVGRASLVRPEFEVTGFGDLYRVPVLGADAIIRGAWLFR